MGYNQDTQHKHDRWDQAKEALRAVLRELPPQTVVGLLRSNGARGGDAEPSTLDLVREPRAYDFANNLDDLDKLINSLPYPEGTTSPLARWIRDAVKDRGTFKKLVGAKTLLVLTDGADNITPDPYTVISDALKGSDVSLKIALFNDGKIKAEQDDLKKALDLIKRIRQFDPPGDFWRAEQKAELIEALRRAMQPQIQVLRANGEVETAIHNPNGRGMQALPLRERFFNWSPSIPGGTYKVSTSGMDRTDLWLAPGDRLLLELRYRGAKPGLQPYRYTDLVVPPTHPQLKATDNRNLVQLAVPKVVIQATEQGGYDLDLLLLMDRAFRSGTAVQMDKPQFVWFEVRLAGNQDAKMADIENVNGHPAPAWKVRVPNWPYKTNPLIDAAQPSITAWWLDSFPTNAAILTRDKKAFPLLANDFRKTLAIDGVAVTVESVRFNDTNQLEVQLSYPKGKPSPVFIRALNLKNVPRFEQEEQHTFYDASGRYLARFGPVTDKEREAVFSLEFQSMKGIRERSYKVELNLGSSPTDRNPLPQLPRMLGD